MIAAGTPAAGLERVPHRPASFERRFGRAAAEAAPAAGRRRAPVASWTSDPLLAVIVRREQVDDDAVGVPIVFEEPKSHRCHTWAVYSGDRARAGPTHLVPSSRHAIRRRGLSRPRAPTSHAAAEHRHPSRLAVASSGR